MAKVVGEVIRMCKLMGGKVVLTGIQTGVGVRVIELGMGVEEMESGVELEEGVERLKGELGE